jgi:hypothetical protein
MKFGSAKYLELIEGRLELLRTLVRKEAEWRSAFIASNLRDSERCTADEEVICECIRVLDKEIASIQAKGRESSASKPPVVNPVLDSRICAALGQMAVLHLDLKHSNDTRRAILRRSKVTINALRNLFNSYAPTYAAPAAPSMGMIYEENV